MLPKVESVQDVLFVLDKVRYHRTSIDQPLAPILLVLSVESANSLLQMPRIIELFTQAITRLEQQQQQQAPAKISGLLFARFVFVARLESVKN